MTAVLDRPAQLPIPVEEVAPDFNDPTAGAVAVSRELASEQVRMIADPAPLGLGAFALTTFLLSLVNAGVLPKDTEPVMLGVALAYGGIAQLLAGMWEFRKGNVFGATVFTSFGAFWLSFWAYLTFFAADIPAPHHGIAAGWYLLAWAIFTTLMLVAALRTTAVLATLFAVVVVVFVLLALGAMTASAALTIAGGVLGIVAAALAWYLCMAGVAASTFGRPVLPNPPLFRR
ncbi:MAG: acetate uptake transporter [Actinomycetota bacterium]|nr:acetate uptake transporter [Actinomycetota bacterium]